MITWLCTQFFPERPPLPLCVGCKKELSGSFDGYGLDDDHLFTTPETLPFFLTWAEKAILNEQATIVKIKNKDAYLCWPCFNTLVQQIRSLVNQ